MQKSSGGKYSPHREAIFNGRIPVTIQLAESLQIIYRMAAEILPPYGIFFVFLWIVYNVNDIRKGQQQRM